MGHALELRHRLPRLWSQVQAGRVPAWRARLVAEATIHATPTLTPEAAGWVDAQVAAVAGRVGPAQLDRLVAEAIKRFELAEEEPFDPDGWQKVDPRHVTIDRDEAHFAGTLHLEAEIDIADALDLDRALAQGAATREPHSGPPCRSVPAGRRRSVTWPGPRPPSTSTPRDRPRTPTRTACPLPGRSCCTPTSPPPPTAR